MPRTANKSKGRPLRALLTLAQPGARLLVFIDDVEEAARIISPRQRAYHCVTSTSLRGLVSAGWVEKRDLANDLTEYRLSALGVEMAARVKEGIGKFSQLSLWEEEEDDDQESERLEQLLLLSEEEPAPQAG